MYPDEIATVRAVLFAYPDVVLLCKTREDEILALMGGGGEEGVHVQGGSGVSCGDRYAMATDKDQELAVARSIRTAVKGGMQTLNRKEMDAVEAVFFKGMRHREASEYVGISTGYLSHVLDSAVSKMAEFCIPVYPLVCRFREAMEKAKTDLLKQELQPQKKEGI
jgi:predicted DNA-binding protein (UPF0251 family)